MRLALIFRRNRQKMFNSIHFPHIVPEIVFTSRFTAHSIVTLNGNSSISLPRLAGVCVCVCWCPCPISPCFLLHFRHKQRQTTTKRQWLLGVYVVSDIHQVDNRDCTKSKMVLWMPRPTQIIWMAVWRNVLWNFSEIRFERKRTSRMLLRIASSHLTEVPRV